MEIKFLPYIVQTCSYKENNGNKTFLQVFHLPHFLCYNYFQIFTVADTSNLLFSKFKYFLPSFNCFITKNSFRM